MQAFWVFVLGVLLVLGGVAVVLLKVGLEAEWIASVLLIVAGISLAAGARYLGSPPAGSAGDRRPPDRLG